MNAACGATPRLHLESLRATPRGGLDQPRHLRLGWSVTRTLNASSHIPREHEPDIMLIHGCLAPPANRHTALTSVWRSAPTAVQTIRTRGAERSASHKLFVASRSVTFSQMV